MNKFKHYKLNLSNKEQELVTKYLDKISHFVKKHDIDKELYNDIEEMVFEKLSKEKNLDQLKIIKILKEVWEPEIIFSDYLDEDEKNNKKEDKELFFEKLLRNWWSRDNKNAWVLWISETLANKVWITVSLMRIILVLLICVWGVSIWLYIIAWIIMPLKWKNYSEMDTLSYFKYQIIKAIKDWAYNISGIILIIIKYISSKSGKIIKFFFKNIFPFFRFIFFFSFTLIFLALLFSLIVIWAMYFTSFSIENIDFTSILPNYFIYWIIAWIIALSILSTSNLVYAISWKNLNKYILSLWWISLLIAVFFWISTWFDLVEKYAMKTTNTQNIEIDLWKSWSGELNIELLPNNYNILFNHNTPNIKLENITWSILKVTVKNTIYGNDEVSKQIFGWLSNLVLKKEDNKIILTNENNKLFYKKVPFSIIEKEIILKIPEWYNLNFGNIHWFNIENAFLDKKYDKYKPFIEQDCRDGKISYKKEENEFICEASESNLQNAKEQYFQEYVINNFDSISYLKHTNKYKRESNNDYLYNSDWDFYDFKFEENNNLNFNFQDNGLIINASLNIEDTASWILVKNFKIENAEIIWENFDKNSYDDISFIKEFIKN